MVHGGASEQHGARRVFPAGKSRSAGAGTGRARSGINYSIINTPSASVVAVCRLVAGVGEVDCSTVAPKNNPPGNRPDIYEKRVS